MTQRHINQEEIFKIVEKGLKRENMHSYIGEINFLYVNWNMMMHNKKEKYYWLDFAKGEGRIMSYHNGYNHKVITIQQVKRYLQQEFDGCSSVILDMRIADDEKLHLTDEDQDIIKLIDFTATIYYEESKLEPEEIREMIEIALMMNDKEWFEELVTKFNTYKGV